MLRQKNPWIALDCFARSWILSMLGKYSKLQHLISVLGISLVLVSSGCSETQPQQSNYVCQKNLELISARPSCLETSTCPCGTSCEFGECAFECTADAQCGGGTCDMFGKCNGGQSRSLAEHFYQLQPSTLRLNASETRRFSVQLGPSPSKTDLRVAVSSPAFAVACPSNPDVFAGSCKFSLDSGQAYASILIRRVAEIDSSAGQYVQVSSANQTRTISIEDTDVSVSDSLSGTYTGNALLQTVINKDFGKQFASGTITVPLDVHIREAPGVAGRYEVAFEDVLGLFSNKFDDANRHLTAGYIEVSDSVFSWVSLGTTEWLFSSIPNVAQLDFVSSFSTIQNVSIGPDWLTFELEQHLHGGGTPVQFLWKFSLDRSLTTEETGEAVQFVLPSTKAPPSIDVASQQLEVETQFIQSIPPVGRRELPYRKTQTFICSPYEVTQDPIFFADDLATVVVPSDTAIDREHLSFDGEVACASDVSEQQRWLVFPIFLQELLDPQENEAKAAQCLAELSATAAVDGKECIDFPRWLSSLEQSLTSSRDTSLGVSQLDLDISSQRLGAYLVNRYLDLLGYIGVVEKNQSAVRQFLDLEDAQQLLPLPVDYPSTVSFISRLAQSLDVLLLPRTFEGLVGIHEDVLVQPDYRVEHAASAIANFNVGNDSHSSPLFLSLMEAISTQSEYWEVVGTRLRSGSLPSVNPENARVSIKDAVRRSLILWGLAQDLFIRFNNIESNSLRQGLVTQWRAENERYASSLNNVFVSFSNVNNSDETLPLPWFRAGDQSTPGTRFRAMTDFLLGNGQGLGGLVGFELDSAKNTYNNAVGLFARSRSESLRLAAIEQKQEAELDDLFLSYGAEILNLCGFDPATSTARGSFDALAAAPNPLNCFVDPTCEPPQPPQPSQSSIAYDLCRVSEIVRQTKFESKDYQEFNFLKDVPDGFDRIFVEASYEISAAQEDNLINVRSNELRNFSFLESRLQDFLISLRFQGEANNLFIEAEKKCGPTFDIISSSADPENSCGTVVGSQISIGNGGVECSEDAIGFSTSIAELDLSCYRGELGEAAINIRSAQANVELAEAELQQILDQAQVKADNCDVLTDVLNQKRDIFDDFRNTIGNLLTQKAAIEGTIAGLNAVSECLSAFVKAKKGSLFSDIVFGAESVGLAIGICATEVTISSFEVSLAQVERSIELAEVDLDIEIELLEANADVKICLNDVNGILTQLTSANLRIRAAVDDYLRAIVEFTNLQRRLIRVFQDAAAFAERIEQRRLSATPLSYGFEAQFRLLSDTVNRLKLSLIYANRAIEYEFQQSLFSEGQIRSTNDLVELETIAQNMRSAVLSGQIGTGNPSQTTLVLSFRDQILQIPEQEEPAAGYHNLPVSTSFQEVLSSKRHAVYDENGTYAGQLIPFTLSPRTSKVGEVGISEFLGGDTTCGERLWSMGAVIVGEQALPLESGNVERILVRKENAFYSKACLSDDLVSGHIARQSQNLGQNLGGEPFVFNQFTNSLLTASIFRSNDSVGARLALNSGAIIPELSEQVAGLGFYGDYQLFIPADSIGEGRLSLDGVQDIFLTFTIVYAGTN